jgi:hypothetical protein
MNRLRRGSASDLVLDEALASPATTLYGTKWKGGVTVKSRLSETSRRGESWTAHTSLSLGRAPLALQAPDDQVRKLRRELESTHRSLARIEDAIFRSVTGNDDITAMLGGDSFDSIADVEARRGEIAAERQLSHPVAVSLGAYVPVDPRAAIRIHRLPHLTGDEVTSMFRRAVPPIHPSDETYGYDVVMDTDKVAHLMYMALHRFDSRQFQTALVMLLFGTMKDSSQQARATISRALATDGRIVSLALLPPLVSAADAAAALTADPFKGIFSQSQIFYMLRSSRAAVVQLNQEGTQVPEEEDYSDAQVLDECSNNALSLLTDRLVCVATAQFRLHCLAACSGSSKELSVSLTPKLPVSVRNAYHSPEMERAQRKFKRQKAAISKRAPLTTGWAPSVSELRVELEESQRQLEMSESALRECTSAWRKEWLATELAASDDAVKKIRRGLEIILSVTRHRQEVEIRRALGRWRVYIVYRRRLVTAQKFAASAGALGLSFCMKAILLRLLKRRLAAWNIAMRYQRMLEVNASILELQRVARGFLGRKTCRILRLGQHATQIQRIFRGHCGRRYVIRLRSELRCRAAVSVIEAQYKKFVWCRSVKQLRRMRERNFAALQIQRVWRGLLLGKRPVAVIREDRLRETRALMIQRLWRGAIVRMEYDRLLEEDKRQKASVWMQSIIRGWLGRERALQCRARISSAIDIQRAWRGRRGRSYARDRRKAACTLVRVARGYSARKYARSRLLEATHVAVNAQRLFRGHIGRVRAFRAKTHREEENDASILIQKLVRGSIGRKRAAVRGRQRKKEIHSAWIIGRFLGHCIAVKKSRRAYEVQKLDEEAKQILSGFRNQSDRNRDQGRSRARPAVEKEVQTLHYVIEVGVQAAEIDMQLTDDDNSGHSQLDDSYFGIKMRYIARQDAIHGEAIRTIQRFARRRRQRLAAEILRQSARYREAAIVIQSQWRRRLGAHAAYARRSERHQEDEKSYAAAVQLQSAWRAKIARSTCYDLREKRTQERVKLDLAASCIQATVRGFLARRSWQKRRTGIRTEDRERRRSAARTLQGGWRCYSARKEASRRCRIRYGLEAEETLEQHLHRLLNDEMSMEIVMAYAIRLQCWWRSLVARRALERLKLQVRIGEESLVSALCTLPEDKLVLAVNKLQAWWRGMKARIVFAAAYTELYWARERHKMCIECESRYASRHCDTCQDQYCIYCWETFHQKGQKRFHRFHELPHLQDQESVVYAQSYDDGSATYVEQSESHQDTLTSGDGDYSSRNAATAGDGALSNAVGDEWVSYYDSSACASYWYNQYTGEATWIDPHSVFL